MGTDDESPRESIEQRIMPVVELFRALGEPTRLEMVERLSNGKSQTISSLSEGLKISRQGARKHLQILADSKIIMLTPKGRDTTVVLNRRTLDICKKFIDTLEVRWEKRLEVLRNVVDKNQ
jgi:DNA-binding transcriptional ArsR family regulator